jgi:tetratricopeptide (TPR) repeat protein
MSDQQPPTHAEQGNPEQSPQTMEDIHRRDDELHEEEDLSDDQSSVSTVEDRHDELQKQKAPRQRKRARKEKSVKRTGNEKLDKLEERVHADKYDTEAWALIMTEVQSMPINEARQHYERFLTLYPTSGKYWKAYAEQEMAANNFDLVEKIFSRCLLKVLHVDLWRCYLTYIRTVKDATLNFVEIRQAYEFALDHVGFDINATKIWTDYIDYLRKQKVWHGHSKHTHRSVDNCLFTLDTHAHVVIA